MRIVWIAAILLMGFQEFDESRMYGKWLWESTSGGVAGITTDRRTSRLQKSLILTRDHLAIYAITDSTTYSARFFFDHGQDVFTNVEVPLIKITGIAKPMIIDQTRKDTLVLRENSYDGLTFVYVKSTQ